MPKISEGTFALGSLFAFALWLFVILPLLYLPREVHSQEQIHSDQSAQRTTAEPKGTAEAPFFVQVIPAPKTAEERAQEAEDREEKKSADWWLVRWTAALFFGTAGLILATGVLGFFAYRQIKDMSRIGEAQIKAYVDISGAEIFFVGLGMLNTHARPMVRIVATNTGQSPAKNFIWNPTVEFISIGSAPNSLVRELGSNWRDILGVGIAVGQSHPDGALVPNMELLAFLDESDDGREMVMVRLRVQFEFEDVFDKRTTGEAYFAGIFKRNTGKIQTDWGETQWFGKLARMHRPRDWPDKIGQAKEG